MKNRTLILLIGLTASAAVAFIAGGCAKSGPKSEKQVPPPVAVTEEEVVSETFILWLTTTGTVEPTIVAGLASPAEGPVASCRIREGDRVKAGQEVLRLGRNQSADAAREAAREELLRQEQEYRRVETLVQEKALAGDRLDVARAALELARAGLAHAEQSTGDYSIRAPWDGVVSRVRVADGNYVAPRAPLIDLYNPESLVLRFHVPEDHAFHLAPGGKVRVSFDAIAGREFTLPIVRAYPELDRRLRTRVLEATREAARIRLRPRLMTTLPVVLGLTPLAFAFEAGGELLRPMAAAAIGGLIVEVFVALFLVPVLYTWFARRDTAIPDSSLTYLETSKP